jgi:serine O-acetyltransferase
LDQISALSLKQILLSDLQKHYYYYDGTPDRQPTILGLMQKIVNLKFTPVLLYRLSKYFYCLGLSPISNIFSILNFIIFGIEIGTRCNISEGLYFPHTVGTVIGAKEIGRNAVIFQNVTIGSKVIDIGYNEQQRPSLGHNVTVGSGAKILGAIIIGNNVTIGANAVVTKSLPDNVIVAGIPARIIRHINQEPDEKDAILN